MCGIAGKAGRAPLPLDLPLQAMADAIAHRGPDDAGVWLAADRCVGLAHRRLSILDLSAAGHQPMTDGNEHIQIVFNGEIYNFRELRAELAAHGHPFHTTGDTEVLIAAYLEWGEACLAKLHGMFAFGLWDTRTRKLLLARDRAGEKPLFFRHDRGTVTFASELKSLLRDPDTPRQLDADAMNFFCAYGYVPGDRCMLQGIHKLPPAHAATYDVERDQLEVRPYWAVPTSPLDAPLDEAVLIDRLEGLLRRSVQRQLVADVPVAVLLSGGLDSSIVTALAAAVSPTPVRTFTVSFPGGGEYDESAHARIVANHFGTLHTDLPMEPASVDLLPMLAHQFDEPLGDSSLVPTYLVSRLVRTQATVGLGGDGGDELFGGYPHYRWVQRQQQLRRVVPRYGRELIAAGARALPVGTRGRNHLLGFGGDAAASIAHINLYFEKNVRARLLRPLLERAAPRRVLAAPERYKMELAGRADTPLRSATLTDFLTYLPEDILAKVDRASMLNSLEMRAPFLDHEVIEFAFTLPDHLRATPKSNKVLLRRLAARLLPAELDLNRKRGFSIPLHKWFKGEWGTFMSDVLAAADPAVFDRGTLDALVAQQRKGLSNTHRIFALTMFELWRREFRVVT